MYFLFLFHCKLLIYKKKKTQTKHLKHFVDCQLLCSFELVFIMGLSVIKGRLRNLALGYVLSALIPDQVKYF